jgi:hypothetical protein
MLTGRIIKQTFRVFHVLPPSQKGPIKVVSRYIQNFDKSQTTSVGWREYTKSDRSMLCGVRIYLDNASIRVQWQLQQHRTCHNHEKYSYTLQHLDWTKLKNIEVPRLRLWSVTYVVASTKIMQITPPDLTKNKQFELWPDCIFPQNL